MMNTPPKNKKKLEGRRRPEKLLVAILVALGCIFIWQLATGMSSKEVPYSEFQQLVEQGKVAEVEWGDDIVRFRLVDGRKPHHTTPVKIPDVARDLTTVFKTHKVKVRGVSSSQWGAPIVLTWGIAILAVILIWMFISRRVMGMGDAVMKFSKSKARRVSPESIRVSFADVAGVDEAKEELLEVIDFLKDPAKYQRLGGRLPKGVLLVGPPGTGKTLLAKAVAGEAGVPFFSMSGSDFVEMFVGVGAARVRDLFDNAKKNSPCIIFIDELDAVGRYRGAGLGGGHDEREQTLNQLLVEMDGFETKKGVIIMAATNRPDVLDPALLRPGRFDRQIVIDTPSVKGRVEILRIHTREVPLGSEVDLQKVAKRTPGLTGADLANVVNEAALLAARLNRTAVEVPHLDEAVERVIAGPQRRSRIISTHEREVVAFHESGHTIVALSLPGADPVHKVSIVPRGLAALGYTLQLPHEDRYITTRDELTDRITALMGGRASELLVFGHLSTGAHNDLEKASQLARKMVCEYGMSEGLGPVALGRKESQIFLGRDIVQEKNYSEETAQRIDLEIRKLLETCESRARTILERRRSELDLLARELLRAEVLDGEEVKALLEGAPLRRAQGSPGAG